MRTHAISLGLALLVWLAALPPAARAQDEEHCRPDYSALTISGTLTHVGKNSSGGALYRMRSRICPDRGPLAYSQEVTIFPKTGAKSCVVGARATATGLVHFECQGDNLGGAECVVLLGEARVSCSR